MAEEPWVTLDQHLLDHLFKQLARREKNRSKTTADRQLRLEYVAQQAGEQKSIGSHLELGRQTDRRHKHKHKHKIRDASLGK
jgi:hypothetical protein